MSSRASASSGGEIVTVSCGAIANWTTMQYMMLQNSNCDINSNYSRHTHFRRTEAAAKAEAGSIVGAGAGASAGAASPTSSSTWMPRLVCMDASVGLDGIVATFTNDSTDADQSRSDELAAEVQRKHRVKQGGKSSSSSSSSSSSGAIPRPKHWNELHQHVFPLHSKSAYSVPGLYEGTSDFHLHEHGTELMQRESVHEEVIDRVRYFLEECDQPDGLHVVVEGNSGWSGVGSTLLDLLRDEYERMPIFCIGTLTPPPPAAAYGRSFASATSVAQSVINSSLLLNAVTAHGSNTAYLPLTTQYFHPHSLSQTILPEQHIALQRGEVYESSMLLAWLMHLNTASYRIQPRLTSLASVVSQLTQQGQASALATRLLAYPPSNEDEFDENEHNVHAAVHAHSKAVEAGSSSSSIHKSTPVLHTMPETFPMSVFGHNHSFVSSASRKDDGDNDGYSASSQSSKPATCGFLTGLNELVHVFGRSSTASHAELINQFNQQPSAQFRHVFGSSRMNLPTTFHSEYYQLLNEGHVASLYRCRALGEELNELGRWLHELNRGVVQSSYYTSSSEGAASPSSAASPPRVLANFVNGGAPQRKTAAEFDEEGDRILGKVPSTAAHQLPNFTPDQLEALSEAGIALQNLSEYY